MGSNPSEDQVMETLHESINSQMRTLHEDQMVSVIHVLISPSVFSDWIIKGLTRHGFLIRPIMSDMHGGWDGPVLARNLIIAERKVSAHYLTNEGDGWWFRSQVPVIYIVEEGIDCQWLSPAEAGAVDYIFKPFPLNELVFRINLALGRLQLTHEVSAKDIQLDLISRRAIKGGRDLNLSPREFELLATLISNQGRVLIRSMLLNRVWGEQSDIDPRTVDVHVHWLRQKIEDQPHSPKNIMTVRGMGYRFSV